MFLASLAENQQQVRDVECRRTPFNSSKMLAAALVLRI